MLIKGVDFPETVLRALKTRSLVIFAGAGVSIPEPSGLPNFDRLAEDVAGGALKRGDGEPVDRFLGRLVLHGVKVHERVSRRLSVPDSAPNSLHEDLLRLFGAPADVRLVTTNFDRHFIGASRKLFGSSGIPEMHFAPALPLGNDFGGVVQLHGSVDKPPQRLVLTDADFGRAYLTEGWARVFLERLFARYVVVFVGYSHDDLVVSYLARGLPPQNGEPRRFALTQAGRDDHWEYLGIVPISYPLADSKDRHSQVRCALAGWADLAAVGALDQEQKIRAIVEQELPVPPEDEDYVRYALGDVAATRFFTRHAKSLSWLRWVERGGFLAPLFRLAPVPNEIGRELASWFAQKFVCEHSGEALALVQREGERLNPILWIAVAHRLWTKDPAVEPTVLAKWLALLSRWRADSDSSSFLDYILKKFAVPGNELLALHLFEYLARPTLALKKDYGIGSEEGPDEDVDFDVISAGDEFFFAETWRQFFKPNLNSLAGRLVPIITAHLSQAHLLLQLVGKADNDWDPLSFSRQAIESPTAVPYESAVEILVDAARDLAAWYTENDAKRADSLIDLWSSSTCPILERIATFAVAISKSWTSDQKIEWLMNHDYLYARGRKAEVFLLLRLSYPTATAKVRSALLGRVLSGPTPGAEDPTRAYEIYNLLYWLADSSPECSLAKTQFDEFAARHPEFRPRGHPDLDVVFGPIRVGWASPLTAQELVSKEPQEVLEFLLSFQPSDPFGADREGLTRSVSEAVSVSRDWGLRLATALDKNPTQKEDLWQAIAQGWVGADFTQAQWEEILEFASTHEKVLRAAGGELARMLEKGFADSAKGIPDAVIPAAIGLSEKLWQLFSTLAEKRREKADDWYFLAINYPGGTLATVILELIYRARQQGPDKWSGIPPQFQSLLNSLLTGESAAAELGRVILASRIHFLFALDSNWTVARIVPLLDWTRGSRSALQAWHGFLAAGRWSDALLDHLMPLYGQVFAVLDSEFGRYRETFCQHLAGIACFSLRDPIKDGWLYVFLKKVASEERRKWASFVQWALKEMKEEAKQKTWDKWLREYWDRRIDGIPLPLDAEEVAMMVEWVPHLGPAFPEAVERVLKSPKPSLARSFLYHDLSQSHVTAEHPKPTAKLLLHTLRSGLSPGYDFVQFEKIFERIARNADLGVLRDVCEELAKVGYPRADELQRSLGDEEEGTGVVS